MCCDDVSDSEGGGVDEEGGKSAGVEPCGAVCREIDSFPSVWGERPGPRSLCLGTLDFTSGGGASSGELCSLSRMILEHRRDLDFCLFLFSTSRQAK